MESIRQGLSTAEIRQRRQQSGPNILVEASHRSVLQRLLQQFANPLTLILLVAAALSFWMESALDGSIIIVIVAISVVLNFVQEYKADNAASKLKASLANTCTVIRDGKEQVVAPASLVPGDIVLLNAGDLIPADGKVLSAKDFFVNESSLTGESMPVEKRNGEEKESENQVFAGTNVVTGSATVEVTETGKNTAFGKVGHMLNKKEEPSEFSVGINKFSYFIMRTSVFIVLAVFLINAITKQDLLGSFMFAIAIAVGITPELLPMIMAITMGNGSLRMAKKGVIVKTLSSIPNLGSMDVLCTDKTGTLTEDKIAVVEYVDTAGKKDEAVLRLAFFNSSFQSSITNPLDEAVKEFRHISLEGVTKIDEVPFDFSRRRMSVVVEDGEGLLIITKGAPEEVLKVCCDADHKGACIPLDDHARNELFAPYLSLSEQGYRVLAIATRRIKNREEVYSVEDEKEMRLEGYIAFLDPAKKDAGETVHDLNERGVDIKIITGDNELVTQKICADLQIPVKGVLLGHQLAALTDDALRVVAKRTTIFARFSPDQKNRIITALRASGHVVGYMGDGINDAPSLRTADVGISVHNAVDVAKESADIILTQKNLRVLLDGIHEGRRTFANSLKYIMMGVSSNFGNMFSVIGAVIFLPFLPMLPIQILLNNLLYDISQITIPEDHVDLEQVARPRRWDLKQLTRFMWTFGLISSLFDFVTFGLLFGVFGLGAAAFQTGWFIESLATQTLIIHVIRTRKTPFLQSTAHPLLLMSTFGMVAIGWLIPYMPFASYLGFVPLPAHVVVTLAAVVLIYLITVELAKRLFYGRDTQMNAVIDK